MVHEGIQPLTRQGRAPPVGRTPLERIILIQAPISPQPKHRSIGLGIGAVIGEIVAGIEGQHHQLGSVGAGQIAPGEQLLAGAIAADAEIEHFHRPAQALANPTAGRSLQAILQLLLPGGRFVHLEGLGEGIPQHRNPQGSWRSRPWRQFGMAKSRLVDAHPTAPLPGPPTLGSGP